jgi:hypothetical protein
MLHFSIYAGGWQIASSDVCARGSEGDADNEREGPLHVGGPARHRDSRGQVCYSP